MYLREVNFIVYRKVKVKYKVILYFNNAFFKVFLSFIFSNIIFYSI